MRFLLIVAMAFLVGCAAPATQPRYAAAELDTAAKRFEPAAGKARIYASTSYWRSCSLIGCINQIFPIAASVYVNGKYAGDLTNLDNFVFVDVDPGYVYLHFNERGRMNALPGAQAFIRAEQGKVYFYRLNGGNGPDPIPGVVRSLGAVVTTNQFSAEQLFEAGRLHIMERRLVLPSEHQGVAGTRLVGGRQPSTSSFDPVGNAAETAGRSARSDPSGQRNAARPPATGTSEPEPNRDRSSQSSPPALGTAPSPATQARSPTSPQNQMPRNGGGQNGVSPTPSDMRNLNRNVEELERMLELYGRL
jgi:hypothetical protein